MNWYYLGLGVFFVLWEIFYIIQRKHNDFGVGCISEGSWLDCKFTSLMNVVLISLVLTAIISIVLILIGGIVDFGVGKEALISLVCIVVFFGLNWVGHKIYDGKTKKKK